VGPLINICIVDAKEGLIVMRLENLNDLSGSQVNLASMIPAMWESQNSGKVQPVILIQELTHHGTILSNKGEDSFDNITLRPLQLRTFSASFK